MRGKRPWRRIVAGAIAGLLLAAAVWLFGVAGRHGREDDQACAAVPVQLPVDLSTPGVFSGKFENSHNHICKRFLRIETDPPFASSAEALNSLHGMAGTLRIADPDGSAVCETALKAENFGESDLPDDVQRHAPAWRIPVMREGTYTLTLEVTAGAPALAGRRQVLVGHYGICGMEATGVILPMFGGAVCLLVAVIIALVVVVVTVEIRFRNRTALQPSGVAEPSNPSTTDT